MSAITKVVVSAEAVPGCERATVVSSVDGVLSLRLASGDAVEARPVLGLPVEPGAGDVVLCVAARAEGDRSERYVVAVIRTPREVPRALTVERDPETQQSVVRLPRGGVRVEADGDLALSATATVRVEGARLEARAGEADVTVDQGTLRARRWDSVVARATQTFEVLETRASRVIARAKNVFHEVEELAQTHAGRVRVVADDAMHLHAKRVLVKADDDVKLRGEKIHLG